MAKSEKEKAVSNAIRQLAVVMDESMDGLTLCVGMYGIGKLSRREYETIQGLDSRKANRELYRAILRQSSDVNILDHILSVLENEEASNQVLIDAIKRVYDKEKFQELSSQPRGLKQSDSNQWLFQNDVWPSALTPKPGSNTAPPLKPQEEGIDFDPTAAYKMTAKPRGVAMIINNRHFTCGMKERIGTDKDAEALTSLFINLGFYTNRFDNLTGKEMHRKIRECAELNHSVSDCVIVSILTHGINGKLYSTDGDLIPVEDFVKEFDGIHCPSLIGKPKIFIIQACRGGKFDYGVESEATDLGLPEIEKLAEEKYDEVVEKALQDDESFFETDTDQTDGGGGGIQALPVNADIMIAYATVPGYVSWRNSEYGSWFIKAFVDTMKVRTPTEHFMDIMIEVNGRVAKDFQSKGRSKQIPAPVVMLTKKLYFRPGIYEK